MVKRAWQRELEREIKEALTNPLPVERLSLSVTEEEVERDWWAINDACLDEMDREPL